MNLITLWFEQFSRSPCQLIYAHYLWNVFPSILFHQFLTFILFILTFLSFLSYLHFCYRLPLSYHPFFPYNLSYPLLLSHLFFFSALPILSFILVRFHSIPFLCCHFLFSTYIIFLFFNSLFLPASLFVRLANFKITLLLLHSVSHSLILVNSIYIFAS